MSKGFKRYLCLSLTALLLVFVFSSSPFSASAMKNNSNTIYLNGMTIKTNENIEVPAELTKEYLLGEVGPYIVAFDGPVYESMKIELMNIGAKLVEYIPDFSFLTLMSPEIAKKAEELPFVDDVIIYQPAFKIHPSLRDGSEKVRNNTEIKINILTFDDSSIDNELASVNGIKLDKVKDKLVVKVNSNEIKKLAKLNSVKYIEPAPEYKLLNDIARGYMGVNELAGIGFNGGGQVVGVCDTGIDTGRNDSSLHLDFQGRVSEIYALGRSTADDPHGHGTHVSGSVLGNGARSNGQYKGIAPEANLVMQSVLDSSGGLGGLPSDLNTLFAQSYNAGARIHTNSWGAAVGGDYTTDSQDVDEYVWNNDMIILFAAGNEGDGYYGTAYDSISAPGTAKNCITVGASENYRPTMPDLGWGNISDNPNQIAPYSSRGNCTDGRMKPDIVAPGTWILSTKSSVAPVSNYWGSFNTYYAYMGGTSMATPLTAGAVAVAREYMQEQWNHTPSPAMMKASIINGGTDLGFGYPSRDQGWGRISLANSLLTKEYKYEDELIKLATSQSQSYTYEVENQNTPLKISLVWTDYPGSTSASKALVNDLDLKITSPSGQVYYGNDFTSPYNSGFDRTNNVENVFINTPEVGSYTVEVSAYNVPQGPQDFALFSSGNFGTGVIDTELPTCSLTAPVDNATVTGTVQLSATATDNILVNRVEFYVDGALVGTDASNPYSLQWNSTAVTNGTHTVQAKAYDSAGNMGASQIVSITVNNTTQVSYETKTFTGSISSKRSKDVTIAVTAQGTIELSLSGGTGLSMRLYNPSGVQVASGTSAISYNAVQTGTYRINISTTNKKTISYTLTATYPITVN